MTLLEKQGPSTAPGDDVELETQADEVCNFPIVDYKTVSNYKHRNAAWIMLVSLLAMQTPWEQAGLEQGCPPQTTSAFRSTMENSWYVLRSPNTSVKDSLIPAGNPTIRVLGLLTRAYTFLPRYFDP